MISTSMTVIWSLIYFSLLIGGIRTTSNTSDETCFGTGMWTIWFEIYKNHSSKYVNGAHEYDALVEIANATCVEPIGIQIEQILNNLKTRTMKKSSTKMIDFYEFITFYAPILSRIDFRIRLCCSINASELNTSTSMNTYTTVKSSTINTSDSSSMSTFLMSNDGVKCGTQVITPKSNLVSRIAGGTNAIPHSWPWVSKRTIILVFVC
jgi:hypothetical protein